MRRQLCGLLLLASILLAQDDPRDRNREFRGHGAVSELIRDRIRLVAEVYESISPEEIRTGLVQVLGQAELRPEDLILLPDQPELRREKVVRGEIYDRRLPGVLYLTLKPAETLYIQVPSGDGHKVYARVLTPSGQPSGQYDIYEVETRMRNQALEGVRFKVDDGAWEEARSFLKSREALKLVSTYTFALGNVNFDLNALREDEVAVNLMEQEGDGGLHSVVKFHMKIDEVQIRVRGSTSSFGFGIVLSGANYVLANLRFKSGSNFRIDSVEHRYQGARPSVDEREALRGEFRLVDSPYGTKEARFVPEAELPRGEEPTQHFCFYREIDDAPPGTAAARYTNFETVVRSVLERGDAQYDVVEQFSVHVYEVRNEDGRLANKGTISLQDLRELDAGYRGSDDPAKDDMTRGFDGDVYRREVRRRR